MYVYEVQLAPAIQRQGLGAFLMTVLKLIAKQNQLEAILLTVMNVRKIHKSPSCCIRPCL